MTDKKFIQYLDSEGLYNFRDKAQYMKDHILYMLDRLCSMIEYDNLPEGLEGHAREINLFRMVNGFVAINTKPIDGKYYPFFGGLGGELDAYYQPTIFTVANPYLRISAEWKIHDDVVIIRNDSNYQGFIPLLKRYGSQLAENDLSMWMSSVLTRLEAVLSAKDDDTRKAAEKFLDDLLDGKLSAIGENKFLDKDLNVQALNSSGKTSTLGDLLEYHQYLRASEYNEIGLNANYNMKREALNSAESSINDDILFPLIDDVMNNTIEGWNEFNELTGNNVIPHLKSSWKDNKKEEEATIEALNPEEKTEEKEEEKPEAEEKKDGENDVE